MLNLAGQAEYDRGRYFQAFEWFEKQIGRYPNGPLLARALNRESDIAELFLQGKKRIVFKVFRLSAQSDGLEILARIAEHAPGTELAQRSLLRIADYHFARKDYAEAVESYDHFLMLHGKSDKAYHAMLQAAQAAYLSFRGVRYDATPLLEAEQRFRIFAQRFPLQARRAGVKAILKQIGAFRAEKMYVDAKFYERVGRRKSSVYYYKQLIGKYPNSQWAIPAREALVRLGERKASKPGRPASQPATQTVSERPEAAG